MAFQKPASDQIEHRQGHVQESQRETADEFVGHPELHRKIVRDHQVQHPGQEKPAGPAEIQPRPHFVDQGQLRAEQLLDEIALADEVAPDQGGAEQPVDDRGLPLNEQFVPEHQGERPEDDARPESQLQFPAQRFLQREVQDYLHGDRQHECAGRVVHVAGEEHDDEDRNRQKIEQLVHGYRRVWGVSSCRL